MTGSTAVVAGRPAGRVTPSVNIGRSRIRSRDRTMTDTATPNVTLHPFDDAIHLDTLGNGRYRGRTTEAYRNMVGPYGGITAAVMLQALLQRPERLGDPVALTVNFAGPVRDGAFEIATREIRTSRSTQHWFAEMVQEPDSDVSTTATAVFGTRRETWRHTEASPPSLPPRETLSAARKSTSAPWSERYDRRTINDLDAGVARSWVADVPPRPLDFPSLASLCDAIRPWLFVRRPQPTPIGTVTLNVYFHAAADELAAIDAAPLKVVAHTNVIHRGFFDQEAQVWSPDGALIATTQQVVWFKA